MKHIPLFICILLASCSAEAGWFGSNDGELKEKIAILDGQLSEQRKTSDQWKAFTGALGVGCVLLFVIGTSLGARTRHDGTRRMERTLPAGANGCKPHLGKAAAPDRRETLAA
jgi:hypothetical protein